MPSSRNPELLRAIRRSLYGRPRRVGFFGEVSVGLSLGLALPAAALAAELPVPCVAGGCGGGVSGFVSQGVASVTSAGNIMNVTQSTNSALLNWQSFNISADGTVNFLQPDAGSTAINRIFQNDPSRIFGVLNANGRVYLLNQNGILFGSGAQVNVSALVASSLDITPQALSEGILGAASTFSPAFALFNGATAATTGKVEVDPGAVIKTPSGGQVFMFAPTVVNRGQISTPEGQTILAGGESVFLLASSDPDLRGVLVEVGVGGTATNGESANAARDVNAQVGQIIAERGNVTLAGLAVNQLGRVSATTSVRANGSIRLQARDGGSVVGGAGGSLALDASNGGTLTVGERSRTDVLLDDSTDTAVDVTEQQPGTIELDGHQVNILEDTTLRATGGRISITASANDRINADNPLGLPITSDDSRVYVAAGATLDVSGATANVAMERNSLRVELRGSQLADSPEQRNGPLRGQTVFVDVRASGARDDGSTWVGTPLADVSANIGGIGRDVAERNSRGGTISMISHGDVILAPTSQLDVSGGAVNFADGYVNSTQLLGADGKIYSMDNADRDRAYVGTTLTFSSQDQRWGVSRSYYSLGGDAAIGRFEQGYVEGKDAGAISVVAPNAILDGSVSADRVAGRHQRLPTAPLAIGQTFRAFDQVPSAAKLVLGNPSAAGDEAPNFVATNITFDSGLVLPTLTNAGGTPFDPLIDPLPELPGIRIQPQWIGAGALGNLSIAANGSIAVPESVALRFAPGGTLQLEAAHISVDGDIDIPSGAFTARARQTVTEQVIFGATPDAAIGSGSSITARGSWINDDLLLQPAPATAPLWIDGGSIDISVEQGGLTLASGSLLDVSAGAWHNARGDISGGAGGSISLAASSPESPTAAPPAPVPFVMGADLRGHALSEGGSLLLEANEVCISVERCNDDVGTLWLTPGFFGQGGFADYSVRSNLRGLAVAPGSEIHLQQRNLELPGDVRSVATGTPMSEFTRETVLPEHLRAPSNLSLRVGIDVGVQGFNAADYATPPDLTFGAGASVFADPEANISLRSNTRLIVDGALHAPGGSVDLTLDSSLARTGFLPSQATWLGEQSWIDVAGVARTLTDDMGRITGDVLDGGSVHINADRGYVIAARGSVIDVSGTAAEIDVRSSPTHFTRRLASSAGGLLDITTAEGAVLAGTLTGGGGGGSDYGGDFSLTVDTARRGDRNTVLPFEDVTGTREVVLTDSQTPVVIAPGSDVPDSFNGRATVVADSLSAAGFDSVSLVARNLVTSVFLPDGSTGQILASFGRITVDSGVDFGTRARLILDAPVISLPEGTATLSSSYLALGNTDVNRFGQDTPTTADVTGGTLELRANFIDVIGSVVMQGARSLTLDSAGDIRLRGVAQTGSGERRYSGSLTAGQRIELRAQQIYPTTMSDFVIAALDGELGTIVTAPRGVGATAVPSAAGRVTLLASTIDHGGVLQAPFGTIEFGTPSQPVGELNLLPGSVVVTNARSVIPFGITQGGFDWTYQLNDQTIVFGGDGVPVPESRVSMNADRLDFASGARIDVSAGADLQAYEFVPGVGGSVDVLDASESPNLFAIVPGQAFAFSPFDGGADYQNGNLRPGDSVFLSGIPGVEAGVYTLMPARYALLPGAFLVEPASGYRDIVAGEVFPQINGSTVVSGYRTVAGTSIRDSRTSGFLVRPGSDAFQLAQYDLTLASDFFRTQALEDDLPVPRLADDAGRIAFAAGNQLNLAGMVAGLAPMGRGAAVDITGARLRIVNELSAGSPGVVELSATQLSVLGAESLLIGGQRRTVADGTEITVAASRIEMESGARLAVPEAMFTAIDSVLLEDGAEVVASGAGIGSGGETLLLQGDSALLRVSSGDQAEVQRSAPAGATGVLDVGRSARLAAVNGSVTADSSLDVLSLGQLNIAGGSLSLGASRISLGEITQPVDGLVLDTAQLAAINARELVLNSRATFDLFGSVQLDATELVLNGAGVTAASAGTDARIQAQQITLENRNGIEATTAGGDGALSIVAHDLMLGEGTFALAGFTSVRVQGTNQIAATERGELRADGALELMAGRVVGSAGDDYRFGALGALAITASGGTAPTTVAPLGARLEFAGSSITSTGRIDAPSGIVEFAATGPSGDVILGQGSLIDVAGTESLFDGVSVPADAGKIFLSSASGDVRVDSGATLDVSAAGSGRAGRLTVEAHEGSFAIAGTLLGSASTFERSGEFRADAGLLGDLNALNGVLTAGGFHAERTLRQRREGTLTLTSDWRSQQLNVTADRGGITVLGRLLGDASKGGGAVLSARDNIDVGGQMDFSSSAAGAAGGRVELRSSTGGVFLRASAVIDVAAGPADGDGASQGGLVHLRLPRASVDTVRDADAGNDALRLDGVISGARAVAVEGYAGYAPASLDVIPGDTNPVFTEAAAFALTGADVLTRLGHADDAVYRVIPGIEIAATEALSLDADWDLAAWRFGPTSELAGVLTLRAAGDLNFNASLSDGFQGGASSDVLLPEGSDSWSYRLTAGADLASADLLATRPQTGGAGTLRVGSSAEAPKTAIRTGTGRIDMAAAGDLVLSNQRAVIYTAGTPGPGETLPLTSRLGGISGLPYPINGGDISIHADGDILGAQSNQLFTAWLWRTGTRPDVSQQNATAWTVSFANFEQNVGALAGGNVAVSSGGDILDLSVSVPSVGRQVGGTTPAASVVEVVGGGDIELGAGGSILGGTYLAGLGSALLRADGAVGVNPSAPTPLAPIFGLGEASVAVSARTGIALETAVNPTLLPQGLAQVASSTFASFYSTYAPEARVDLVSAAGDVVFGTADSLGVLTDWFNSMRFSAIDANPTLLSLSILPPTLRTAALSGDVRMGASMVLYPAPRGDLELFADGDLSFLPSSGGSFVLSDADPALLPTPEAPERTYLRVSPITTAHALTPVHARENQVGNVPDPVPVRLVARRGSISAPASAGGIALAFAKPARIVAGLDILDLPVVRGQNLEPTDITSLIAGRDIAYSLSRDPDGAIRASDREIVLGGPGRLEIQAGRNLNLQTSKGISTVGSTANAALSDQGASVSVLAGLADAGIDIDSFVTEYFVESTAYEAQLIAYVEARSADSASDPAANGLAPRSAQKQLDKEEALRLFAELSTSEQMELITRVFFSELRASGRFAAQPDPVANGDFSRGFAAIDTLFPGSNPDLDAGETNPYSGGVQLYFSKIYTLFGGDIDLMAPGGEVNVGLSAPPASFGVVKEPSDLGVVVRQTGSVSAFSYDDLQVNESRVFAADGGDILVWSTRGDIDAGRGAKTAISAPPPIVTVDASGQIQVQFSPALTGSGIQTLATSDGVEPGDVDLFAPRGVVNAGDAGIVAGNLTIAATAVLGADNIQVSGVAVGVPVDTGGLGASLSGVSAAASSASSAATAAVAPDSSSQAEPSAAQAALSWLDVFVVGFGEEQCAPTDVECLKRQKAQAP